MTEGSATDLARARLGEGAALVESMLASEQCVAAIGAAAEAIAEAMRAGRKLLVFGNGGSAADAVHIAAEFVGRYLIERQPLPAVALVANPSTVTAIGNDYGFEQVFSRQVQALGVEGDVALGLTTSGTSANVVEALNAARELGMTGIAMTGADPRDAGAAAEITIAIPSDETPRIQEGHMLAAHIVCEWVEARLASS
ncbi:MAG TPA: SIS domain-containing protein [Solirubrobacterales bacterium]|jgi:D-sedoheptulose 7-phosphate isomerase|nr:SIS domain-containing protein [Solirubrobacterales bacterium]